MLAGGVGDARQLVAVVVGHLDAVQLQSGVVSQQGRCHKEGARQAFQPGHLHLTPVTGIGLVYLLGEIHGVVYRGDIVECAA